MKTVIKSKRQSQPVSGTVAEPLATRMPKESDSPIVRVVLFSGGRGSTVLSQQLINHPAVKLTIAINGYDDGASTGEVRRFLGDSLGPSDYRKNASRLAIELNSCESALIDLLNLRFPVGYTAAEALQAFQIIQGEAHPGSGDFEKKLLELLPQIEPKSRELIAHKLDHFRQELAAKDYPFNFSDCSIGNLVFAGCFLAMSRNFNDAIEDYCAILRLPPRIIENITDGTNAFLVALNEDNRLLVSEAEIVDDSNQDRIKEIYLIDRPPTPEEKAMLENAPLSEVMTFLEEHAVEVSPNPRLLQKLSEADLIIYAPGTQYSSLYPSYLTPSIGITIAKNLSAIKLLITNIQEDAETSGNSAVDLINRAVYYLKEKDSRQIPTPCLITHYLVNDPSRNEQHIPYIPLGEVESLEDPRLLRIGDYEEGLSGRHNAAKVLTPFIESFLKRGKFQRVGILLLNTRSLNKIGQTILEMLRAGIQEVRVSITVYYYSEKTFHQFFTETLPFNLINVYTPGEDINTSFRKILNDDQFDYFILFESSGMYNGEDLVSIASHITNGRLDAVWGSRRLSVKDIHYSYKLRYRKNFLLGAISYIGSQGLSLIYLLLYGRYITDTLSEVRAIRANYLRDAAIDISSKSLNQQLLSILLRTKANIFESPVQFFSLSPDKVKRTTILDGIKSLLTIIFWRFKPLPDIPVPDKSETE